MECLVALLFLGGIPAFIYFFMRMRQIERSLGSELAALRATVETLKGSLAARSLSKPAVDMLSPETTGAGIMIPESPEMSADMPTVPVLVAANVSDAAVGPSSIRLAPETQAAPPRPARPEPSKRTDPWDALRANPIGRWFMDSHLVVRAGIVILFIGVAFLLRFVAEQGWFSLEMRLSAAALLGVAMAGIGWGLRARRRIYALSLQGGGLGIVYMTTFAAYSLYELVPAGFALAVLAALGILCGGLAVINDAKALAVLAVVGGFAAPILASSGEGSHIALFTYFTFLNIAILGIAWFKAWHELNLVGFVFTLALASLWGAEFYRPEFFASVQPFLILFFLFYVTIGLFFARRQPPRLVGLVDGPVVFGTPVAVFIWQARLVEGMENGLALSALGLGIFYFALGALLFRTASLNYAALREAYLAIGSTFIVLAVPFAFEPATTVMVWAVAGAALFWVGLRQGRRYHVLLGGVIQVGAGIWSWIHRIDGIFTQGPAAVGDAPFYLNSFALGGVLLALAGLLTGYLALTYVRRAMYLLFKRDLYVVTLSATLWGLLWWYGIGLHEIIRTAPLQQPPLGGLALFFVASAAVGVVVADRLRWWTLRTTGLLLWLPVGFLSAVELVSGDYPLLIGWGWLAWPGAVAVHYYMLWRLDATGEHGGPLWLRRVYHALGLWLVVWLIFAETLDWAANWELAGSTWYVLPWALAPLLGVLFVVGIGPNLAWPVRAHTNVYERWAAAPLVTALILWTLITNFTDRGDVAPLRFIPVLNPLALVQIMLCATLFLWVERLQARGIGTGLVVLGRALNLGLVVIAVSGELARFAHQWWEIPFALGPMLESALLQATYSLVWTGLAMFFMFWGAWRKRRWIWLMGAALLGLTIFKLFLVDLSAAETIARIVSFIGVGLLMLLIGYFAPMPTLPNGRKRPALDAIEPTNPPQTVALAPGMTTADMDIDLSEIGSAAPTITPAPESPPQTTQREKE